MNKLQKILLVVLIVIAIGTMGCSASKKGCGCPNTQEMVGY